MHPKPEQEPLTIRSLLSKEKPEPIAEPPSLNINTAEISQSQNKSLWLIFFIVSVISIFYYLGVLNIAVSVNGFHHEIKKAVIANNNVAQTQALKNYKIIINRESELLKTSLTAFDNKCPDVKTPGCEADFIAVKVEINGFLDDINGVYGVTNTIPISAAYKADFIGVKAEINKLRDATGIK
jgi:hypothetical protein